jgi:hypothetical protein
LTTGTSSVRNTTSSGTQYGTEEEDMARIHPKDWTVFELAMEVNEPPTAIGSMFFKLLEDSGYTTQDIATVARTLYSYVD